MKVKLAQVCSSISDGDHLPPPKCESGIPFVTISDIKNNKFNLSNTRFVPKAYFDTIDAKRRIRKGDVLYSVVGSYGIPVYADKDLDIAFQRHIAILKPRSTIDSRFLYYSMLNPAFYSSADNVAIGAAQKTITLSALRNLEIPLPPLPVQRRIADILSAYDDLIENNRRRIAILEETARLTYRKWFGGIEQGRAATLGEICREVRRGVSPDAIAPDTPYIGLEHMPRRSISLCEWESAQKVTSTKLAFEAGDILFGKIRPYFHKVGITFVDGVASSDAIVIKPLRPELHAYVLMTVSSDAFVAAASQGMKEGSKMPRADWKQLLNYSVSMPDDDTLAEFNRVLNPILEQLKTLCFSIRNLVAARDLLLPRLMKGGSV
ncbi:MAG: restriction endonuclease subunit S [Kiritimatiellae bacterium]|nr:restriction endonuclease subunit S [Kiritimatiellia bacterium]